MGRRTTSDSRADTGGPAFHPPTEPTRAPWRFFVAVSPLLLAGWVALTRISDYWHHPTDVMAGTTLGLVISYLVR